MDGIAALGGGVTYPSFGFFIGLFKSDALVCRSHLGHLKAHVAFHPTPGAVGTATPTGVAISVASGRPYAAETCAQVLEEVLESWDGRRD